MSNLYNSLSEIYEGMYQTFINYQEEFDFYHAILRQYHATSVLEVACGTGHLSGRFMDQGISYTGVDLSDDMLAIAKRKNPGGNFFRADMRDFTIPTKTDACIIPGRSISYLLSNKDVLDSLHCFYKNLKAGGIVCFDCIDASKFIPGIKGKTEVIHQAAFNGKHYQRNSIWTINLAHSWAFDWHSTYYETNDGGTLHKIGEDHSTIRAFTREEIMLMLTLADFKIKEIKDRPSYAFETFVVIAHT